MSSTYFMSSIDPEIRNLCAKVEFSKEIVISRAEIGMAVVVTVPRAICRERLEALKRVLSSILIWNSE